jgi:ABC-type uncharacterized transport system substrate-binding protein
MSCSLVMTAMGRAKETWLENERICAHLPLRRRGDRVSPKMKRRAFITLLGGAAAWPLAARAQQPAMPVIGFLSSRSADDSARVVAAFREGLAETGYVDGRNAAIEFRWAQGEFDRLPVLAAELVRRPVSVLAAVGGSQTPRAAQAATNAIPIVFGIGQDPVKEGLVPNFNRPGANVTGATFFTALLGAKRLGLLRDLVPKAEMVGLLVNQHTSQGQGQIRDVQQAARDLGLRLLVLNGGSDEDIEAAFCPARGGRASRWGRSVLRHEARSTDCVGGAASGAGSVSVPVASTRATARPNHWFIAG